MKSDISSTGQHSAEGRRSSPSHTTKQSEFRLGVEQSGNDGEWEFEVQEAMIAEERVVLTHH